MVGCREILDSLPNAVNPRVALRDGRVLRLLRVVRVVVIDLLLWRGLEVDGFGWVDSGWVVMAENREPDQAARDTAGEDRTETPVALGSERDGFGLFDRLRHFSI